MKMMSFPAAIPSMLIAVLFTATAAPAASRYHVRLGGSGDGSSWAQAGGNLQTAIDSGNSEVWVAAGTYYPSSWPNGGSNPREMHFALRTGVTVLAGFPDNGDPGIADRDPAVFPTICSGDIGSSGDPSDNVYHVFYHPVAITGTAVLDGVTITAGNANDPAASGQGAGMYNHKASPTLIRCLFIGNTAKFEGGGVYQISSGTYFDHCVFHQNSSGAAGGGVFNELSKPTLSHCVFAGNTAPFGGAIRNLNESISEILSCSFYNNTGSDLGGGIHNETNSSAMVINSILWGDAGGEVIDLTGCASTVRFCTIEGGWSGDGDGNLSLDPLFAQSGDPDGPDNLWATHDDGLRLTNNSPAIDMGDASLLPPDTQDLDRDSDINEPTPFDLRMLARIAGKGLDQGAYEFQRPIVTFNLGGHATRTGGGELVQELEEGADAKAPTLAVDLNWTFTGWDQPFTNVFSDRTVTALYTPTFPAGGICHVRAGGSGNGTTWTLAMGDVQQAIDVISAAGGGQVWIAAGTYLPSSWPNGGSPNSRERHFSLRNGVTVLGGFSATGNPGLPDRYPPTFPTALSGDLGTPDNTTDNAYHVFYHQGITLDASARLDGVTITGGNSNGGPGIHEYGAGMFNNACSPTLVRCVFTANSSAKQAGGLYLGTAANSAVVNCVFANNSATNEGGAIYIYQSSPVLVNCLFSGNTAHFGSAAFLFQEGPTAILSCTFSGNSSVSGASTIHLSSSTATLSNCILWNNPGGGIGPLGATLNSCISEGGWSGPGSNNLSTDPLFANAANPDGADNRWGTADDGLHPTAAGSAFNSGNPSLLPADLTDIDGDGETTEVLPLELASQPRVRGAQLDRGAYETSATIIYHVRVGGTGNGLTWATAMGDPQAAIQAAAIEGNSQVWIAAGIYLPDSWPNGGSADPREKHFALRNGVAVFGGFPTTGNPAMIDRNPAVNLTVFSGDLGTMGVNTDNAHHVFYHPNTALDSSARLDGVTITGGNANGTSTHLNGAGMYNHDSSPALVRCHFQNNTANSHGGGLYLQNSLTSVVSCIFSGNSANEGGACYSGNPRDTSIWANCIFSNNSAVSGGALYFPTKGSARFVNCTFVANSGNGGAINNYGSQPVFDNSILWGNTPNQIIQDLGTATLDYCIIQDGWTGAGSNNTDSNPLFVNAGNPDGADGLWGTADDGLQPLAASPAINGGNQALLPLDLTDINSDGNTAEVLPFDLNQRPRVRDVQVDRGAYEPLSPVIFHVRSGGTGNGFTWATAMGDPQAAIEAAATATNSQVWIAAGTYQPSSWPNGGSAPCEKHFSLRNDVPVYGGFPVIGDPALIDRNPTVNATVFSGDLGTPGITADNVYHVFYHPASAAVLDSSARLDGVVITGGNADQTGGHESGGGMFNEAGSPALVRCRFQANTAVARGAGLHLGQSTSSVINCIFTGNTAGLGGAAYIYQGSPTMANCVFTGNTAIVGAGIAFDSGSGTAQIINCTFVSNGGGIGGGVYTYFKTVALKNCIFWFNGSYTIREVNGIAILDYCIIDDTWGGAGSNNTGADPLFTNAGDPDGADNLWSTADDGLQPTAASPAVNSGNQALLPADLTDIDGDSDTAEALPLDLNLRPRVRDVQVDRGAYEALSPMIFHVRSGGTGSGFTWATAMGDPQAAIEAAAPATNSQVWIAAGTYRPASWPNGGSTDREKHFSLRNNVPVYGGFPTDGDPALTDRNPAANPTVFSGDIGTLGNSADNAYHVFYHPGGAAALDSSARLDGVRITGGNANVGPNFVYGGGMFNSQSSPMIVRCVFYDNTSASQAGGLYLGSSSNSSVVNCVFTQNHANEGGGLFVYEAAPVLSNCLFVSNSASGAGGGGVRAFSGGNPSFINCTFTANSYGALKSTSSTVSLSNCILWGNSNYQISSTSATLDHCIIQGGWAGSGSNNLNADPLFANPGDPAGPDNLWGTADDGLRPVLPSPAIQAGNPALLPADLTDIDNDGNTTEALPLDLIGNARVIDGLPEPGAYEFVPGSMSLAYWRTLHFSAADRADPAKEATVWGNNADSDGDGTPNCGEYLLLLNPGACDSPLGQLEILEWWGMRWLLLSYTVATDRPDVALAIQYSADLTPGSWTDLDDLRPSFPHYLIDETSTTRTWELLVPVSESHGFVRMGFTVAP